MTAPDLDINRRSIELHRASILCKSDMRNRAELVAKMPAEVPKLHERPMRWRTLRARPVRNIKRYTARRAPKCQYFYE